MGPSGWTPGGVRRVLSFLFLAFLAIVPGASLVSADEPKDEIHDALHSPDVSRRFTAIRRVSASMLEDCIPDVVELLKDDVPAIRREAAVTLGRLGADSDGAVPALREALDDPDANVRRQALLALGKIGALESGLIPRIARMLGDDDVRIRTAAAYVLGVFSDRADAAIDDLAAALADPSDDVRRSAALAIRRIGPASPQSVVALLRACGDRDHYVRSYAMDALQLVDADAIEVLDQVIGLLNHSDRTVRIQSANVIARFGSGAALAVPALIRVLEACDDAPERSALIGALGGIGAQAAPATEILSSALSDESIAVRRRAAHALLDIGPDASAAGDELVEHISETQEGVGGACASALRSMGVNVLPALMAGVAGSDTAISAECLELIGNLDAAAAPAVPMLIEKLSDSDERINHLSVEALGRIGSESRAAVPALAEILRRNPDTRDDIALALGRIGPGASEAIPVLIECIESEEDLVRRRAGSALGMIGRAAVTPLVDTARHGSLEARLEAVRAIGVIGEDAGVAVSLLVTLVGDENEDLANRAGRTLRSIGERAYPEMLAAMTSDDEIVRSRMSVHLNACGSRLRSEMGRIIALLKDERVDVRVTAATLLAQCGESAAPAVGALVEAFDDDSHEVRVQAIEAIGKIGPAAAPAVTNLAALLDHDDSRVREHAAEAIGRIGVEADTVIPKLVTLLYGGSLSARRKAVRSMRQFGPAAVPALIAAIEHEDPDVRWYAIDALGKMGRPAAEALPAIRRALKDEDETVRRAASWAVDTLSLTEVVTDEEVATDASVN